MKKIKLLFDKIKTYLLIIISLALIITCVQLYQEKQKSKRQYDLFLNQFYHEMTSVIRPLDSILEQSLEGKELEQALLQVKQNLEGADFVLDAGSRYVNRNISSHTSFFSNHPINQFADDNTLINEEVRYLENLKKDLETIQMGLYSDETGQENPEISIRAFNDIVTGSGYNSGFLTEYKSIAVPFQMIELKQAPKRIRKWMEQNTIMEQNKVFLVNGRTYILIASGNGQDSSSRVKITNMTRTGNGITVSYEREKQGLQSDDANQESAIAIVELEMEAERFFQFITQLEVDEENENTRGNNTMQVSGSGAAEMVIPKRLSKDGKLVK